MNTLTLTMALKGDWLEYRQHARCKHVGPAHDCLGMNMSVYKDGERTEGYSMQWVEEILARAREEREADTRFQMHRVNE